MLVEGCTETTTFKKAIVFLKPVGLDRVGPSPTYSTNDLLHRQEITSPAST